MSNPNIYGPLGSQTVTWNGDQPTVNQTLNPNAQSTLDAQQRVQLGLADLGQQGLGTASNALTNPFSFNGPNIQTGVNTSGVAQMPVNAGQTGQAAIMARLQPQITQQQNANRQTLANQGIPEGSEAWNNAMRDQNNQENDLLTSAATQGLNLDMSANNQGYNQALQGAQFGNTATGQSLQQQLALRNQPLNEITGLMAGSQIQMPQFQGYQGQNVQAAPLFQAAQAQGQNAMDMYGINSQNNNSANSGMTGLMGSGLMAGAMFL